MSWSHFSSYWDSLGPILDLSYALWEHIYVAESELKSMILDFSSDPAIKNYLNLLFFQRVSSKGSFQKDKWSNNNFPFVGKTNERKEGWGSF